MNLEYESYKNVSGPHFPSDVAFHHFKRRLLRVQYEHMLNKELRVQTVKCFGVMTIAEFYALFTITACNGCLIMRL
jgi:hypothetical protein